VKGLWAKFPFMPDLARQIFLSGKIQKVLMSCWLQGRQPSPWQVTCVPRQQNHHILSCRVKISCWT
jgi:hypothetical protein